MLKTALLAAFLTAGPVGPVDRAPTGPGGPPTLPLEVEIPPASPPATPPSRAGQKFDVSCRSIESVGVSARGFDFFCEQTNGQRVTIWVARTADLVGRVSQDSETVRWSGFDNWRLGAVVPVIQTFILLKAQKPETGMLLRVEGQYSRLPGMDEGLAATSASLQLWTL